MEIITICGSIRFKDEMIAYRNEQIKNGKYIFLPENMEIDAQIDDRVKWKVDRLHLQKILHSDSVLIWNRNHYIGESTKRELEFAKMLGMPILFLEENVGDDKE